MAVQGYEVFMMISTEPSKIRGLSKKLMKYSEVSDLHELYGEWDIILKIKSKTPQEVEDFIREKIRIIPEIKGTRTLVVSDIPK